MPRDDDALALLTAPRAQAVEHARVALLHAQHAFEERECVQREAHAALKASERAVHDARVSYVRAASVAALRAAERLLALRESTKHAAERALCVAQRARDVARLAVREREQALSDAEVGRRAVADRIDARAELVRAHTERLFEDEADDAHRTAAHARARRTAAKTLP